MKIKFLASLLILGLITSKLSSQESLPIYTDYLTDNIYLIHPSGAGISNYAKIRLTGRKQWMNYADAPELQTLSFHSHLGNNTALGVAFFNDKNGHFSQAGGKFTFAYHINLDEYALEQFSFGLSALFVRNTLDASNYNIQDSDVSTQIYTKNYYNTDIGVAYRNRGIYALYSILNLLETPRNTFSNTHKNKNLRRHLISLGYHTNMNKEEYLSFEPSLMIQYIEQTKELSFDTNLKVFVPLENGNIYGGLSYRISLNQSFENPNYFSPFLGFKYKNYIVSYTYTKQINKNIYSVEGFHQITLGYNFYIDKFTRKASWDL